MKSSSGSPAVALAVVAAACQPSPAIRPPDPGATTAPAGGASASATAIAGFGPAAARREHGLQQRFLAGVSPDRVSAFHRTLTAEPHRATSPRNTELARWIAAQWRAQGWDEVALRTYEAYFSEPEEVALDMVAPVAHRAALREDAYDVDPSSRHPGISGA